MHDYYAMQSYSPVYGYSGMRMPSRNRWQYYSAQQSSPMIQQPQRVIRGFAPYTYPQNFMDALELIREAVKGEAEDRAFYEYLLENAPDDEAREIIRGIRDDEINHFFLFGQVYNVLTGQTLTSQEEAEFEEPDSYCAGIASAIIGEQDAVKRYRRILYALNDRVLINVLTDIITDEIRHGILYNYLYSKAKCSV